MAPNPFSFFLSTPRRGAPVASSDTLTGALHAATEALRAQTAAVKAAKAREVAEREALEVVARAPEPRAAVHPTPSPTPRLEYARAEPASPVHIRATPPAPAPRLATPTPVEARESIVTPTDLIAATTIQFRDSQTLVRQLTSLKNDISDLHSNPTAADRDTKQRIVMGGISGLLASRPALKTAITNAVNASFDLSETPETILAYLTTNSTALLNIVDEIGTPLIELMLRKYTEQLSQIDALRKLYILQSVLTTTPFNGRTAQDAYNDLPVNVKGKLAFTVWQRNGERGNGDDLIKASPLILLRIPNAETPHPLAMQIAETDALVKGHVAEAESPIIVARRIAVGNERAFSEEHFHSKITSNQLAKFNELISTPGTSKGAILDMFHRLPVDIKSLLAELVWRVDGEPVESDYGMKTINNHPWIFLSIKNSEGKNIVQQLIEHTDKVYLSKVVKDYLVALRGTLTPVNAEAFRAEFANIKSKFPALAEEIGKRVWLRDRIRAGQTDNPDFGGFGYGDRILETNPATLLEALDGESIAILPDFINEMQERIDLDLIANIRSPARYDTSATKLAASVAEKRIAMITAEFKGIHSEGGLGEAVLGMAKGLGGRNVSIIMPKYDILPEDGMTRTAYTVHGHAVFRKMVGEIECFLIEDDALFNVGKTGDKNNSIYGGSIYGGDFPGGHDAHVKARFAYFQEYAAELALQFYRPDATGARKIDIVHVQDSQTALVPTIYAHKHNEEWKRGETPPVVFTYHNNLPGSQGRYEYEATIASLRGIGLDNRGYNSFMEGLASADAVTTVSAKFANESSSNGVLGRGTGSAVRKSTYDGKLFDVLNGNTIDWDPKTNAVLKAWTNVDSLDLPADAEVSTLSIVFEATDSSDAIRAKIARYKAEIATETAVGRKVVMDLTYGPTDHPLVIAFKKELCKEQVAKYFAKYKDGFGIPHGTIDPKKPLLLNFGRLDPSQKGIDKLPYIMDTAVRNGAQMVCIGLDGEKCQSVMDKIHEIKESHGRDGAIVIQDERIVIERTVDRVVKKTNSLKWQGGHIGEDGREVPGIGPLLRAAADICVFPSEFEPCGLVQGESFLFGGRVLATDTGGFHDTVISEGDRANGWLFSREEEWYSDAQVRAIGTTLVTAIEEVKEALYTDEADAPARKEAFYRQSAKIMADAKKASWTDSPDRSPSPVEKLRRVYDFATKRSHERGYIHFDLLRRDVTRLED